MIDYKERARLLEKFARSLLERLAQYTAPQVIADWRACMEKFGHETPKS